MRVAVLGAGALGSVLGAALARAGAEVTLIDRNAAHLHAIRREGLRVEGVLGVHVWHGAVADDPSLVEPCDLVLVMVDGPSTAAVAPAAARLAGTHGRVATLQNGIGNAEALADAVGLDRVIAGSTYNSAAFLGPGRVLHSNLGGTVLGDAAGGGSAAAKALAQALTAAGLPSELSADVMGHVWSKFLLNVAINPVAALTGLRPGEIVREPAARELLETVLDEALAVVAAKGIVLPEADPRSAVLDHAWERYNRPSMLQHIEQARRTEIESLTGALVREAATLGVPVPANATVRLAVLGLQARGLGRAAQPVLDEAALEAAARATPRMPAS